MSDMVQAIACLACGESVLTSPPQFPDTPGPIGGTCGFCGVEDLVWAAPPITRIEYDRMVEDQR